MDDREMLEYLCWSQAASAEGFWPIEETAWNCAEAVGYDEDSQEFKEALAWEKGQHARAVAEAGDIFKKLHMKGYDPVAMAEREIERCREKGQDLPDVDWSWLKFTMLPDEYVSQYTEVDQ